MVKKKKSKVEKEIEIENILDKLDGIDQKWKIIAKKGNTKVIGLYKNYIGWDKEELAEIRIKFEDNDDEEYLEQN
jgi:hypothetical protein